MKKEVVLMSMLWYLLISSGACSTNPSFDTSQFRSGNTDSMLEGDEGAVGGSDTGSDSSSVVSSVTASSWEGTWKMFWTGAVLDSLQLRTSPMIVIDGNGNFSVPLMRGRTEYWTRMKEHSAGVYVYKSERYHADGSFRSQQYCLMSYYPASSHSEQLTDQLYRSVFVSYPQDLLGLSTEMIPVASLGDQKTVFFTSRRSFGRSSLLEMVSMGIRAYQSHAGTRRERALNAKEIPYDPRKPAAEQIPLPQRALKPLTKPSNGKLMGKSVDDGQVPSTSSSAPAPAPSSSKSDRSTQTPPQTSMHEVVTAVVKKKRQAPQPPTSKSTSTQTDDSTSSQGKSDT